MKATAEIKDLLPKHLIWDTDYDRLNLKRDKDFIIPRALYATTKSTFNRDINLLERYYNKAEIITTLKTTKERISNSVCELVSKKYQIEPFYRYAI